MTDQPITRFVIVGGGTAGWMTAALLARFLDSRYSITLVESDDIGTVGVGEATIPGLRYVNRALGFDEADFVRATKGTFKLGIEFDGWREEGHRYIHAFGEMGRSLSLLPFYQYWLRHRAEGGDKALWDFSACAKAAYAHKFAPVEAAPGAPPTNLAWAYHFDAGLYASYLRRYAEANGVERIDGTISHVECGRETGRIERLVLENGQSIEGQMFLDCSGFRSLLLGEALGIGFDDWSEWLPCDRAWAVPCKRTTPTLPYTRAIAREAGWQWRIPLQHRTGNGHVFASAYMAEDEACDILLSNLDSEPLADPRLIRFTTGMRRESWHGNCVAIGLAAGFMEPLESTSIHLVQSAVERFLKFLPGNGIASADVAEYNRQTRTEWEAIRDFLILHYHRNNRSEPFWRDRAAAPIPDSLANRLALFEENGRIFRERDELFAEIGWVQVMLGQGVQPQGYHPIAGGLAPDKLAEFMDLAGRASDQIVARMPSHDDFIARHCAAEALQETI